MTKFPEEIKAVRDVLGVFQTQLGEDPSIPEIRAGYEQMAGMMPMREGVDSEAIELAGVSGVKLTPSNAVAGRTVLYWHGGGYVIGSPNTHKGLVAELAHAMQATAYLMDYRLAPEHAFPAACDDGLACYKALLDMGQAPETLLMAGDSAGGGLTMATALQVRDAGLAQPAGLIMLSPWVNLANEGASWVSKAQSDPMITKQGLDDMTAAYLQGQSTDNPLASPVTADLAGLPSMLIQTGSEEALLTDSTDLAARAADAKVMVTLEVWPEMTHVFQSQFPLLTDARSAIARIGRWAEDVLAA